MLSLHDQNALISAAIDDVMACSTARLLELYRGSPTAEPESLVATDDGSEGTDAVLSELMELQQDLWDLAPSFIDPDLPAHLFPRDLTGTIRALEGHPPAFVGTDILRRMCSMMPAREVERVSNAASFEEKALVVRTWWEAQPRPFVPIDAIDRELSHPRRWRRLLAARHLAELGGPDLVAAGSNDIDREALARWRVARSRGLFPVP